MERYLKIAKINFKFNLLPHILVGIALCIMAPFLMGVKNLDAPNTAKILDVYLSLLGIILLVPLFLPDQDKDIRDVIESKSTSMTVNHLIRLGIEIVALVLIISGFMVYLKSGNCEFPYGSYLYGTIANCVFLGGLGLMVYAVVDNLPVGYMVPVLYYILCYGAGKRYLGKFYLFSMMQNRIEDKIYLLCAGIIMMLIGILYRRKRK